MMGTPAVVYNNILQRRLNVIARSQIDHNPPLFIYQNLTEALVDVMKSRIKNHHQNVLQIVGGTGSGKSTLGYQIAKLMDPFCTLEDIYIYDNNDLAEKLSKDPRDVSPINFLDEGSVILNSNRHATKEATDITVIFDTMRSRGMTTILCAPKLRSINNRIREDHIDFLLITGERSPLYGYAKRGFYKLFIRTQPSSFSDSIFWKPVGWGIFKPLSPRMDKEYQEYKRMAQERLLKDFYKNYGKEEEVEVYDGDY